MSNADEPLQEMNDNVPVPAVEKKITYPPKYVKEDKASNIWLKSIISLALYLALGYYFFKRLEVLLLITAIVMIHELGHFFAMKFFRYNDLGIFFIPLLGAYVSGTKREVSQKQSAVILLAGPLPGILLGILCYIIWQKNPSLNISGIPLDRVAILFLLLNLINLLPIYPLDGGQLLNRIFLEEEGWISKIFVFVSTAFLIWAAWSLYKSSGQPFYFILLLFPLTMLMRMRSDSKYKLIDKRIETEAINTDLEYEDLPDEDYWKIRNIIIEEHPSFKDVSSSPPFEYDEKEEKIMMTIQSLLHRHLIQDVSIAGKILIFLIWIAAIASPWLINMDLSFFKQFGF